MAFIASTSDKRGNRPPKTVLTVNEVKKILELLVTTDLSQEAIGKRFGVTRSAVNAINNVETWRDVVVKWCEDYKRRKGLYPYLVNKL